MCVCVCVYVCVCVCVCVCVYVSLVQRVIMRVFGAVLLAAAAATIVAVSGVSGQGFRTGITLGGLQNFEQAIIDFVNADFQNLALPDMHLSEDLPVIGKVDIDLTEITITDFHIPNATFSLSGPSTIGVGVSGTGLSVKLKFHWRKKDWPHISDHGDVTAVPKRKEHETERFILSCLLFGSLRLIHCCVVLCCTVVL